MTEKIWIDNYGDSPIMATAIIRITAVYSPLSSRSSIWMIWTGVCDVEQTQALRDALQSTVPGILQELETVT